MTWEGRGVLGAGTAHRAPALAVDELTFEFKVNLSLFAGFLSSISPKQYNTLGDNVYDSAVL